MCAHKTVHLACMYVHVSTCSRCVGCACVPQERAEGVKNLQLASSGPDAVSESDGNQGHEGLQPAVTLAEMSLRQKTSPQVISVETVVPTSFS